MLIHLGRGVSVHSEDVIVMTDLQKPLTDDTSALLAAMQAAGRVRVLGPEPKTMVLCRARRSADRESICFLSCVGLRTLRLRAAQMRAALMAQNRENEVQHG